MEVEPRAKGRKTRERRESCLRFRDSSIVLTFSTRFSRVQLFFSLSVWAPATNVFWKYNRKLYLFFGLLKERKWFAFRISGPLDHRAVLYPPPPPPFVNLRVYLRYTVSTSHARPATKRSYSSLPTELDIIEVLSSCPWATYSRAILCVSRLKQITIKALQIASCRLQDSNLQRSWETNAKNAEGRGWGERCWFLLFPPLFSSPDHARPTFA